MGDLLDCAGRVGTFSRRRFLGTALAAAIAAPVSVAAPPPGRFRVAFLWPGTGDPQQDRKLTESILEPLRRFGYVDGKNITVITRSLSIGRERLERGLMELRRDKLDALVVLASAAPSCADKLKDVPIIAWNAVDPVAQGLAKSLSRPGGMITGTHSGTEDVARKQVQLLRALVPDLAGVTCWVAPNKLEMALIESAVREAGLRFRVARVKSNDMFPVLQACRREGFQAVIYPNPPPPFTPEAARRHADAAIQGRVAVASFYEWTAENGFLLANGEEDGEWGLRIAIQLDRVLRGAKPAETPFIGPSRFFTWVNRSTAKALGLTIAPDALLMVDRFVD